MRCFNSKRFDLIAGQASAFTLVEIMVSMAVFMLVIGGVMFGHMTGLKMYNIMASKVSATDGSRKLIGKLSSEIRSAKTISVGTGTRTTFTEAADGSNQVGNAIMIYPTTNTANFVRYYLDTTDSKLRRVTNTATNPVVIAEYISNRVVFASESYDGQVLTERQNNRVTSVRLQFFQIQYPITKVGPGSLYDYYQVNTRITRRTLE